MNLAQELGVPADQQSHLFYATLLAPMGGERGAGLAEELSLPGPVSEAVRSADEFKGGPTLSGILHLAQTAEAAHASHGPGAAVSAAEAGSGSRFDPGAAKMFRMIARRESLWRDVARAQARICYLEPRRHKRMAGKERLDQIFSVFADIADGKSCHANGHSAAVAKIAVAIARAIGLRESETATLRHAALLHDLGMLGIPNAILDKPGKLSHEEWLSVKRHPDHSREILRQAPALRHLSEIAGSHHERIDGTGYPRGSHGAQLPLLSRILAVANRFQSLLEQRSYRAALPAERAFAAIRQEAGRSLDADCVAALERACDIGPTQDLMALSLQLNALRKYCGGNPADVPITAKQAIA
jgi:hypothetical protein